MAYKYGLNHAGIHNIGSSWYCSGKDIVKVSNLSAILIEKIYLNEFGPEIEQGWPKWHQGVTNLYGCELAINHIYGKEFDFIYDFIDGGLHKHPNFLKRAHLHAWHTGDLNLFTKHAFAEGKYNERKPEEAGMDTTSFILYIMFYDKWKGKTKINYEEEIHNYLVKSITEKY